MQHQDARDLFSQYLDADLAPEQTQALQEHLASCAECKNEYELFSKTVLSIHQLRPVPVPEAFGAQVRKRLYRRRNQLKKRRWMAHFPFEWISFFLIMVMLAIYFYVLLSR